MRRLYFDLIGLPPTPADVDAFVKVITNIGKLVDKLLASDHYGERMAMYWLDLVRYADTVGYHGDQDHNASPYRDYVIDAFNLNIPFDRFTREQLAGDLVPHSGVDQKIATCYNRLLQTSHEGGVQAKEYLAIYAADRVRNLSAVWMGATVGCAQCHNHKYDPYTQKDFYSLAAFFADVDEAKHLHGAGTDTVPTKRPPEIPVHTRLERERLAGLSQFIEQMEQQLAKPNADFAEPIEKVRKDIEQLKKMRDDLRKNPRLVMVTQSIKPRIMRVLPRGNWQDDSGEIVQPAVPAFLGKLPGSKRATRLDLANWLTDAKNGAGGLTARVFVNRLWYLFFGVGLSRTLEDFGGQGEPPVYPEVARQPRDRIRRKRLGHQAHGEVDRDEPGVSAIVDRDFGASREGPRESPLCHGNRRGGFRPRTFAIMRLAISGLLVLDVGGPSVKPYQPAGYYRHLNFPKRKYVSDKGAKQYRRGVYVHWQRQYLHPMLKAFDAPTREECTAQRPRSNTPLAALVLLNDPTFVECARVFAQQIVKYSAKTDEERISACISRGDEPKAGPSRAVSC